MKSTLGIESACNLQVVPELKLKNFKLMRTLNTITRSALLVQAIISSGRIQN